MTFYIADIASYQKGLVPAALRPGIAALIVKCTQGSSYVDPFYAGWLTQARGTGLLLGAYHYVDGSSPQAQAANLKAHIVDPSLVVMLDSEDGNLLQQLEVADAMDALGLHVRIDYLARSYWAEIGSPDLAAPFGSRGLALVNAAYPTAAAGTPAGLYPGDGSTGWNQYGGIDPTLWQFTNAADEDGQRIDVSAFRGSLAQLQALFNSAPAAPAPAPTPQEEEMLESIRSLAQHPDEYVYKFKRGTATKVTFGLDGYGEVAQLRVAVWGAAGPLVHEPVNVGGKTGLPADHETVISFPAPANEVYMVTVVRLDHGGAPVGVTLE